MRSKKTVLTGQGAKGESDPISATFCEHAAARPLSYWRRLPFARHILLFPSFEKSNKQGIQTY